MNSSPKGLLEHVRVSGHARTDGVPAQAQRDLIDAGQECKLRWWRLPHLKAGHAGLQLPCKCAGEEGDVSEVRGATGQAPNWVPPKGVLEYVRVPGHAPGQMAFLHKPSGSLLMADTIANLGGGLIQKKAPQLGLVPPGDLPQLSTPCVSICLMR